MHYYETAETQDNPHASKRIHYRSRGDRKSAISTENQELESYCIRHSAITSDSDFLAESISDISTAVKLMVIYCCINE